MIRIAFSHSNMNVFFINLIDNMDVISFTFDNPDYEGLILLVVNALNKDFF
jgi:hypothetical protein